MFSGTESVCTTDHQTTSCSDESDSGSGEVADEKLPFNLGKPKKVQLFYF